MSFDPVLRELLEPENFKWVVTYKDLGRPDPSPSRSWAKIRDDAPEHVKELWKKYKKSRRWRRLRGLK